MKRLVRFFVLWVMCWGTAWAGSSPYRVLVSIPPLQGLATKILYGISQPHVLISGNTSPHSYLLKPSDRQEVETAHRIFWIGPSFESFLGKVLHPLSHKTVTLMDDQRLRLLPAQASGCHHHGTAHDTQAMDPHFWLDPHRAREVLTNMYEVFSRDLPQHKEALKKNYEEALKDLDRLHQQINEILAPVRRHPFMVFHDGYQYFVQAFGLRCVGIVTSHPHLVLKINDIEALRRQTENHPALVVFSEIQFPQRSLMSLKERLSFSMATLDPIGKAQVDRHSYDGFLLDLATTMAKALGHGMGQDKS